jgi:hypothetical protein
MAETTTPEPESPSPRILRDNEDLVLAAEPDMPQPSGVADDEPRVTASNDAPVPAYQPAGVPVDAGSRTDAPQAVGTSAPAPRGLFDTATTQDAPASPAEAAAEALAQQADDDEDIVEDPEATRSA